MLNLPLALMALSDEREQALSAPVGLDVLLSDLAIVRRLALRLAEQTDDPVRAGQLHAFGLVHDHQRRLLESIAGPGGAGLTRALAWLVERFGRRRVRVMLSTFRTDYLGSEKAVDDESLHPAPPARASEAGIDLEATQNAPQLTPQTTTPSDTATGADDSEVGDESDAATLGQLVLLWLANDNPAAAPFRPLFDDRRVEERSGYRSIIASLDEFFSEREPEPANRERYAAMQAPVTAAPSSPADQLRAVLASRRLQADTDGDTDPRLTDQAAPHDASLLRQDRVATRAADARTPGHHGPLLRGLDILREEEKPGFAPGPPPPPPVPDFAALAGGVARYSAEAGWMRELVLVAKNVLVWLDQLSRHHGRTIEQLDQIPDDELARLRRWGITGLWLIGIWQRSAASARIKQLCGNPEAAASAYAVDDYVIDAKLGGDAGLARLTQRAARHGIRLACDMVPNHMGLDSRWVLDHPERFLQVEERPFPGYRYDDGPDLSPRPEISLHLEEGYFDRRDAAVVFRRTGPASEPPEGDEPERGDPERDDPDNRRESTFIYHGNDGTSLPWNDTAQLDFMREETRQAVLETILEVAKRFPIIRFDAAMTLARQHVQRLWHPLPGSGGDVPSRAEHAVDQTTFDRQMPEEFWRHVVDRAAAEAPDTLLLAEAFWLMETYFVRSLGMHRVYNSAFMHMIRDEDNIRFHRFVAEALAFDPGLVARFVSFATTPDEPPAAEQFGTGDKYFAVATLLFAMPGTPLIGHGQIEGLREKYGMEYRRAYSQEEPETETIRRHEAELVPLLARRALFAAADAFELYVFEKESPGGDAEDVIAVSNRLGASRGLAIIHNRAGTIQGRLRRTVPRPRGEEDAASVSIAQALGVDPDRHPNARLRGRDLLSSRAVAITGQQLEREGLRISLGPYERIVWADLVLVDAASTGVSAQTSALEEKLASLLDADLVRRLLDLRQEAEGEAPDSWPTEGAQKERPERVDPSVLPEAHQRWAMMAPSLMASEQDAREDHAEDDAAEHDRRFAAMAARLDAWLTLHSQAHSARNEPTSATRESPATRERPGGSSAQWPALLAWVFVHSLGRAPLGEDATEGLRRSLFTALASLGCTTHDAVRQVNAASRFCSHPDGEPPITTPDAFTDWLARDADVQALLGKHEHDDVTWIEQEGLRTLCWWLTMTTRLDVASPESHDARQLPSALLLTRALLAAEEVSGYRWQAFLDALRAFDPAPETSDP